MKATKNQTLKNLFYKYRHGLVLLYFFPYMIWFSALEKTVTHNYTPVHIWLDNIIPFNEFFIIPYLLWFVYIGTTIVYFFFTSKEEFYKVCAYLFIGMTISLIIYTVWPNGQDLRPTAFKRDNIFVDIVKMIYSYDTHTNVFPSIHVFNSIGAHIAIVSSNSLKDNKPVKRGSFILAVLICLSTVFLKQHSVMDGFGAVILAAIMYLVVYVPDYSKHFHKVAEKDKYQFEN